MPQENLRIEANFVKANESSKNLRTTAELSSHTVGEQNPLSGHEASASTTPVELIAADARGPYAVVHGCNLLTRRQDGGVGIARHDAVGLGRGNGRRSADTGVPYRVSQRCSFLAG